MKKTMAKLLPNLPIEKLTKKNDYIGIIEKGELIKSVLLNNKSEFSEIKIFSIYGEWGSGKSTLMKYLEKELKGSFNTFFFEAWEYESDKNLANSLLEHLSKESDSSINGFLKNGKTLMEGFAKAITLKTPFANFSTKELIKTVEDKENTFYEVKKRFADDFIKWENQITTKDKSPDYNIVFIDDLDRCEPESVLNLLSAIKLFFTFGKKTIFFCGIDKKAVNAAVKNKYGETIKANEYLEKVFDVSFTMTKNPDISKLVNFYFDEDYSDNKGKEIDLAEKITDFFKRLHFTNPRRIKKILNKYLIIKSLVNSDEEGSLKLPNIVTKNHGTLFETYLTFYLLILKEFEPNNFEAIFNLTLKRKNYAEVLHKRFTDSNGYNRAYSNILRSFDNYFLSEELKKCRHSDNSIKGEILFPYFYPINVDYISGMVISDKDEFIKNFNLSNKKNEYHFMIFLFDEINTFSSDFKEIAFSLKDYKDMISNLI